MNRMIILWGLLLSVNIIFAGPSIQHWQTKEGAKVLFVASHELPMLDIKILFSAGAARDKQQFGLAKLTSNLLPMGAGELNADQIAEQLEQVGAQLSTRSARDSASVSLRSLTEGEWLQSAIKILNKVLTEPSFNDNDMTREKNKMLAGLQYKLQSPADIAEDAFYKAIYQQHPYANPPQGTKETINRLTQENLRAFHRQYYVANNASIVIVGDLRLQQAEILVEQILQGMSAGKKAKMLDTVPKLTQSQEIRINFPSKQTHIIVGQPGMKRHSSAYFPLYVGNHILGGSGLVSTLSDVIREKRGLAYSVYSYFMPMQVQGPFIMGLQTKNEKTQDALRLLKQQLILFLKEGPSAEALQAAKQNIVGGIALNLDSNGKIANYLTTMGFYQMPLDYLETLSQRIEGVTLKQLKSRWNEHIDSNKMVTVIVGKQ